MIEVGCEALPQFYLQSTLILFKIVYSKSFPKEIEASTDYIDIISIFLSFISINYSVVSFYLDRHLENGPNLTDALRLIVVEITSIISQPFLLPIFIFLDMMAGESRIIFAFYVYLLFVIITVSTYSNRNVSICPTYFTYILDFFHFDIFVHNMKYRDIFMPNMDIERRRRVHIKGIKAGTRLLILILYLSLALSCDIMSTLSTKYQYQDVSYFVWPLHRYIIGALCVSIIGNLSEIVYFYFTGCTFLDWILIKSRLIE